MNSAASLLLFYLAAFIGSIFFAVVKRRVDFMTVSFYSAILYFLPGFFGYVLYPEGGSLHRHPLAPETYRIMVIVLTAILLAGVFSSSALIKSREIKLKGSQFSALICLLLATIGLIMTLATTGYDLLNTDKQIMMRELNRWRILASFSALVGSALAYASSKWFAFGFCWVILAMDVYIGFRSNAAIAFIAVLMLYLTETNVPKRLILDHRFLFVMVLFGGGFFFVYKNVYILVKAGDFGGIVERITSVEHYKRSLLNSEPFTTQAILNEVIERQYYVGPSHLADVVAVLVPFAPEVGFHPVSFGDLFQDELFPAATWYGMGSNFWAQGIAIGGWAVFFLFLCFYLIMGLWGSLLIYNRCPSLRAGIAVVFSFFSFYIYRNDLLYQIILERRVIVIWVISVGASMLLALAFGKSDGRSRPVNRRHVLNEKIVTQNEGTKIH